MLIRLTRRLVNRLPLRQLGLWALHKAGPKPLRSSGEGPIVDGTGISGTGTTWKHSAH